MSSEHHSTGHPSINLSESLPGNAPTLLGAVSFVLGDEASQLISLSSFSCGYPYSSFFSLV